MNMRAPLWVLCGILPVLAGCYGSQLFRQPVTVEETARNVEATRQQQAELEKRLQKMEAQAAEMGALLRTMKAEEASRWEELNNKLLALDSKLRDALPGRGSYGSSAPFWSAAPAPQTQTAPEPGPSATGPLTGRAAVDSLSGGRPPAAASAGDSLRGPASPAPPEAETKRVYDQAYWDLTRGNYSLAVLGFREYLRRNPASDLSDNAQYWVGECFYAQRDFNQAIVEFTKVAEQYPRGDKVPAALLKIGYSYLQLDDRAAARRYLNQVIDQFPQSDEAGLAKNKLRSAG
jgi:tol-pal system protein YbgF